VPVVELRRPARRPGVNQTIGALGVEPQNPVADNLKTDITEPSRIPTLATIVYLSQRKKPPALSRILRDLGKSTQNRPIKIIPQRIRSTHDEPPILLATSIQIFERLGIP